MRTIKKIIPATRVNMGGNWIEQPLPSNGVEQIDPFLLIHHWKDVLPGGQRQQDIGVGPHPHRGFAPVSLIYSGALHHRDSMGYDSIVREGGTQWMNSGRGVIHSERPDRKLSENGGMLEFIQFWVNAPANHKLDEPFYQPLSNEETPKINKDGGKVQIGVVAGQLDGASSKIVTYSPMLILRVTMKSGSHIKIPVDASFNALIYLLDGKVRLDEGVSASAKDMIWFKNDGETIALNAEKDTRLILLAGEPIGESLATYGPFVMNNQRELMQAIQDYQAGKMGELREEFK